MSARAEHFQRRIRGRWVLLVLITALAGGALLAGGRARAADAVVFHIIPGPAVIGDTPGFAVGVQNPDGGTGAYDASSTLTITTNDPVNILLDSSGVCAGDNTGTLTCTLGAIADGGSDLVGLTVTLSNGGAPYPDGNFEFRSFFEYEVGGADQPLVTTASEVLIDQPFITIQKVTSTSHVSSNPQEEFAFNIIVQNTGNVPATGVRVRDALPAGLTLIGVAPSFSPGVDCSASTLGSPGIVDCSYTTPGGLQAGSSFVITALAEVTNPSADGTIFNNTATIDCNECNPGTPLDHTDDVISAAAGVEVLSDPLVSIHKTVDPVQVAPGGQVTYTLTIIDLNDSEPTISWSDTLPFPLTLDSANPVLGAVCDTTIVVDQVIECLGFDLVGSQQFELTAVVPAGTPPGTILVNTATLNVPGQPSITVTATSIVAEPSLEITKLVSADLVDSSIPVTFVIAVTNTGPVTLTDVGIEDALPGSLDGVGLPGVAGTGAGLSCVLGADFLSCGGGTLDPGETHIVSFNVVRGVEAPDGLLVTNTARAFSNEAGPVLTQAQITTAAPDLELQKLASKSLISTDPPETFAYFIVLTNDGHEDALDVEMTDTFPAEVEAEPGTYVSGGITCEVDLLNAMDCEGDLPQGASVAFTIPVTPSGPLADLAKITNTVGATCANCPGPASASLQISVQNQPQLLVEKTAGAATVAPGGTLGYTVTVTNQGGSDATNVEITDVLPAGLALTTSACATSGAGTVDHTPNQLECSVDVLEPGETLTLTLTVTADAGLTDGVALLNQAHVLSDQQDQITVTALTTVVAAKLTVEKVPSRSPISTDPDSEFAWFIIVKNIGSQPATGIEVNDSVPASLEVVNVTGAAAGFACTVTGNDIECTGGELDPGESAVITVAVRAEDDQADGTAITNTVVVDSDQTDLIEGFSSVVVQNQPQLLVEKAASAGTVAPGGTLGYTVTVTNQGGSDATNVEITDSLPTGLALTTSVCASSGAGTVDHTPNELDCSVDVLEPGETLTLTLTVTADAGLTDGVVLLNQAHVLSDQQDQITVTALTTVREAQLTVQKLPSRSPISTNPDSEFAWFIVVTNTGLLPVTDIDLDDDIDPSLIVINASANPTSGFDCVVTGQNVHCSSGALDPGESAVVTVAVRAESNQANGTIVNNSATVTSAEAPEVTGSSNVVVHNNPQLLVEKTADLANVAPGGDLVYTVTVTNTGGSNATNVEIVDTLPAGVTLTLSDCDSTGLGTVDHTPNEVECAIDLLEPGETLTLTLTVEVDAGLVDGTVLLNEAHVSSDQEAQITVSSVTTVTAPKLEVEKLPSRSPVSTDPDSEFAWFIIVKNTGSAPATNIEVNDSVPASLEVINVTGAAAGFTCTVTGNDVECTGGTLNPGESAVITVAVRAEDNQATGTVITNTVTVDSDETEPVTGNSSVVVQNQPQLLVEKTADLANVAPGGDLVYTVTVTNTGGFDATNVEIVDTLPAGVTLVSSACVTSGGGAVTHASPSVECSLDVLEPGETLTLTLTVEVDDDLVAGTVLLNEAHVSSDQEPQVTVSSITTVIASFLEIEKLPSRSPISTDPDSDFAWFILVKNTGSVTATNVSVTDTIDANLTILNASGATAGFACGIAGQVVTCTGGTLAPGESAVITVAVRAAADLPDGTILNNTATVDSDQTPPRSGDANVVVQNDPQLSILKTGPATVEAGGQATYTILIHNTGGSPASITVDDVVPVPFSIDSVTCPAGFADSLPDAQTARCVGTIAANTTLTMLVVVDVPPDVPDGTILQDTALLYGSDPDTPAMIATAITTVLSARLEVEKLPSRSPISTDPDSDFAWYLIVKNTGAAPATGITISDTVDASLTILNVSPSSNAGFACTVAGQAVSCSGGALDPGESAVVTVALRAATDQANGTVVNNSFTADSDQTEPVTATSSVVVQNNPQLSIQKTGPLTVEAGGTATYSVLITNTGGGAASVRVDDVVPAPATITDLVCPAFFTETQLSPQSVRCEGVVAANSSVVMTVTVAVPLGTPNGAIVQNTAYLYGSDPDTPAMTAIALTTVRAAKLEAVKLPSRSPISTEPDSEFAWFVVVTNTGDAPATGVTISDTVDASLEVLNVSANPTSGLNCTVVGQTVSCSGGSLEPGESATLTIAVRAAQDQANGTIVNNTATVDSAQTTPITASANVVVQNQPQLLVEKLADRANVPAGDNLTYTVRVRNLGDENATNVVIRDTLPADVTLVSSTCATTGSGTVTHSSPSVECELDFLEPGETLTMTLTVTVDEDLADGTVLLNQASVISDQQDEIVVSAVVTVLAATLQVDKVPSRSPISTEPDSEFAWFIVIRNTGTVAATGVTMSDTVDSRLAVLNVSATDTAGFNCSVSGQQVNCTGGTILPGGSATITVAVAAWQDQPNGTVISNSATVDSDQTAPTVAESSVVVHNQPQLLAEKTVDLAVVDAGGTLTYAVTATNAGGSLATNVEIVDTLPPGVVLVDSTCFQSDGSFVSHVSPSASCTAGAVLPGETVTLELTVMVGQNLPNGTPLLNQASVISDQQGQVVVSALATVLGAYLEVEKVASESPISTSPATEFSWTVVVHNTGAVTATGVTLTDTIHPDFEIINASGATGGFMCTVSGQNVSCTGGSLAPGASASVNIAVRAVSALPDGTVVNNTAMADSSQTAAVAAHANVVVLNDPLVSATKTASADPVVAGGEITYTLTAVNRGDGPAEVEFVDALPALVVYQSSSAGCSHNTGVVTCSATVDAGDSVVFTVEVLVSADAPDTAIILNSATLTAPDQPAITVTAVSNVVAAALRLIKVNDVPVAEPGQIVTSTILVTNEGNAPVEEVDAVDTLPADATFVAFGSSPSCSAAGGGPVVVTCAGQTLAPGSSLTFLVRWQVPEASGGFEDLVNVAETTNTSGFPDASGEASVATAAPLQLFEGWNELPEWLGATVLGVNNIIETLNLAVDPDSWTSTAHFDQAEGEWVMMFRDAPLESFNTLRRLENGKVYWIYVTTDATLYFPLD